jgi:flagellar hook-associated protein 2
MGRITSGVGLVSGINHQDIIDQLMKLEARPKDLLQTRIDSTNKQKLAYTDLQTRLGSMRIFGQSIQKPQTFAAATTTSSDENVLTATAANGAAIGTFQFQVARLVTTQQAVSSGFVAADAKVGAGTITIEQGGGEVSSQTLLSDLRGGAGIRRGAFRITDGGGNSAVIDVSAAVSIDDVIKKINTSLDISVRASVDGDSLKLTDTSGLTTTPLTVTDLADGHAAEDLGLVGQAPVSGTITGTDINFLSAKTTLAGINDGRGIRRAATGNDLAITVGGTTHNVSLASAKTLGDVFDLIKTGTNNAVTASVDPGGNGIKLTGSGPITVADVGTSKAATDLGLTTGGGGGTLSGGQILAGIDTVLVSSLNGGSGLNLGSIQITNAAGASATVDLSGAKTVKGILDAITASGINVKGALNASGNGIQVTDASGGTGALTIAEAGGGTTAADLGLLGAAPAGTTAVSGKNLQRQWVSDNTLLSQFNGGKGVSSGSFKITNAKGNTATVSMAAGAKFTIGDVIRDINSKNIGVTASINSKGDGLLLTDSTGGGLKLKVENVDGTSANDLNIAGTSADGTTIDGSFEKTLAVTATDTLATVQQKLTDLNFGVLAQVISDGSSTAPFRLSLSAKNAGRNGRVVFDAGTTNLATRNLVEAQDAAVFLGSADSAEPLLITAGKNQLAGVIKGVTIDLHGVSDKPVNLNVTRSVDSVLEQVKKFADDFNGLVDKIKELTKFDPESKERGLLLGDSTVRTVETNVYTMLNTVVSGAGQYRVLGDVGIKLGEGAKIEFDEDKFRAAYANDPDAVGRLFTTSGTALGAETPASRLNRGRGLRTMGVGTKDFKIAFRDGTSVDVELGAPTTLKGVMDAINAAAPTKVKVEIRDDGKGLRLTDLTGATTQPLKLSALNGSQAMFDLGLSGGAVGPVLDGRNVIDEKAVNGDSTGFGAALVASINKLVDPVNGVVVRENKSLDEKTRQFQDRIETLDKMLETKRDRLVRQFSSMETVLAGLQSQQTALGQIQNIRPVQAAR